MAERMFKALADPTRQRILQTLARAELMVSELVDVLRLPQSTVSRHLRVLREGGLVQVRTAGTSAIYAPVHAPDADSSDLGEQILAWLGRQPLLPADQTRLDAIIRRHRNASDEFFARIVGRWDQIRVGCFGPTFHLEAFLALLPRDWTVLDLGTGTGYLLPALSATFANVVAVDAVDEMLEAARLRCQQASLSNVALHLASATALPLSAASIDLAIATLVLHHEPAPAAALAELYRVVRPGGRLLIVEQRAHELHEFHELMRDRWWGFQPEDLSGQVLRAGFTDLGLHTLATVEAQNGTVPAAPGLFVLTGSRPEAEPGENATAD